MPRVTPDWSELLRAPVWLEHPANTQNAKTVAILKSVYFIFNVGFIVFPFLHRVSCATVAQRNSVPKLASLASVAFVAGEYERVGASACSQSSETGYCQMVALVTRMGCSDLNFASQILPPGTSLKRPTFPQEYGLSKAMDQAPALRAHTLLLQTVAQHESNQVCPRTPCP